MNPIEPTLSQSQSDADLAAAMKATCIALRTPPEDKSPLGRFRSAWYAAGYWWEETVFHRYPTWFKHACWSFDRWWHEQITCRLWPRQRWLTRQVPRDWRDLTNLIPDLLYASVIHFVSEEGEDCFGRTDWEASGKAAEAERLKVVYAWAKEGRAAFQKRIEDAYPNDVAPIRFVDCADHPGYSEIVQDDPRTYEQLYGEVNRLEAEFAALDAGHMKAVIDLLPHLWT